MSEGRNNISKRIIRKVREDNLRSLEIGGIEPTEALKVEYEAAKLEGELQSHRHEKERRKRGSKKI